MSGKKEKTVIGKLVKETSNDVGALPKENKAKETEKVNKQGRYLISAHLTEQGIRAGKNSLRRDPQYKKAVEKANPDLVKYGEITGTTRFNTLQQAVIRAFCQGHYYVSENAGLLGQPISEYEIPLAKFTGMSHGARYGKKEMKETLKGVREVAGTPLAIVYKYQEEKGKNKPKIYIPQFTEDLEIISKEWIQPLFAVEITNLKLPNGKIRTMLRFYNIHKIFHHQIKSKCMEFPNNINTLLRTERPRTPAFNKIYISVRSMFDPESNSRTMARYEDRWLEMGGLQEQMKDNRGRAMKTLISVFQSLVEHKDIDKYYSQTKNGMKEWVLIGNKV